MARVTQGCTDDQMIMALLLLNLAGGDSVDDVRVLEGDEGFCRLLRKWSFTVGRGPSGERSRGGGASNEHGLFPLPKRSASIWSALTT